MSPAIRTTELLSWDDFERMVAVLIDRLSEYRLTGVYGVPRGGLVLATVISHRMGIPLLGAPVKGCVVVDDISDTGRTLLPYEGRYVTATLYYAKDTQVMPDVTVRKKSVNWVVFPWEDEHEGQ